MFCHKCGNKLEAEAAFCNKCGAKMGAGDTPPVTNAPTSNQASAPQATSPTATQVPTQTAPPQKKIPGKLIAIGGAAIALIVILLAVFVFNQGGANSLVGTWSNDYNPPFHYTFHENGNGTRGVSPFTESFTWRLESGNTVVMTFPTTEERWDFTIRGDSLTFTGDLAPGMYAPFTRVASPEALQQLLPSAAPGNPALIGTWDWDEHWPGTPGVIILHDDGRYSWMGVDYGALGYRWSSHNGVVFFSLGGVTTEWFSYQFITDDILLIFYAANPGVGYRLDRAVADAGDAVEQGADIDTEEANQYPGVILFNGVPVSESAAGDAHQFEYQGVTLDKNRDELVALFGEPLDEGFASDIWWMSFYTYAYSVYIDIPLAPGYQPPTSAQRAVRVWVEAQDTGQSPADPGLPAPFLADLLTRFGAGGGSWQNSYMYVWDFTVLEFHADFTGMGRPMPGSFIWWITESSTRGSDYLLHVMDDGGDLIVFHIAEVAQNEIALAYYGSYAFDHFFFYPFD